MWQWSGKVEKRLWRILKITKSQIFDDLGRIFNEPKIIDITIASHEQEHAQRWFNPGKLMIKNQANGGHITGNDLTFSAQIYLVQ